MKILIDMNLSPEWVREFSSHNIEATHWSAIGKFDAPDIELINWSRDNHHIIFTHDLDFGTILAISKAQKPSVIQVRTQNVTISHLNRLIFSALKTYEDLLEKGALLIIDDYKQRIRILPL